MKLTSGDFRWISALAALALGGCGKSPEKPWEPTMENPPVQEVAVSDRQLPVPLLEEDDVVVSVNGICLTKRDIECRLACAQWTLAKHTAMPEQQRAAAYRMYGRGLVEEFVNEQLLTWEARKEGLLTREEVLASVETNVLAAVKTYGMSASELDRQMPGGLNGLKQSAECGAWSKAYVTKRVPPDEIIDDQCVSNVLRQIDAENREIAQTNALRRAKLEQIRRRIVEGKEDFGKLSDAFTEDINQVKDGSGQWGTFRPMDLEDSLFRESVFMLSENEVSPVLEDDEGYNLVKMIAHRAAVYKDGQMKEPETAELGRILIVKEQPIVLATKGDIKQELQKQVNDRCLSRRLMELHHQAKIVYPHGSNFWNVATDARK